MGGWTQARNNILRDAPQNREIEHKKLKRQRETFKESTSTWEDSFKEALITVHSFDEKPEVAELSDEYVIVIQKKMNG